MLLVLTLLVVGKLLWIRRQLTTKVSKLDMSVTDPVYKRAPLKYVHIIAIPLATRN